MRSEIKEYQAAEEAALKFVKSVAGGNSEYAEELFSKDAVPFGYLDGKPERGSIERFYRNVDEAGADENFKARIDVLDVEENLAAARVLKENRNGGINFSDVLVLLKIDGERKRVAKAYNQNSDTIKNRRGQV